MGSWSDSDVQADAKWEEVPLNRDIFCLELIF